LGLAQSVDQQDSVAAFGEVALHALRSGDPDVTHVLAWQGNHLVGYGQADARRTSAELAVSPPGRRQGVGRALIEQLMSDAPGLRIWAHGGLPAARALADALGLVPVRELWQMATSISQNHATSPAEPPAGIVWRAFIPAKDQAAWVKLNATAFADHPEQGSVTLDGLQWRMEQNWFDPAGLILAVAPKLGESNNLVGFHWTKIKDGVGEVYAIGVHPHHQGKRLGTALLERGLKHLAQAGVKIVELFVEANNAPALATYQTVGFKLKQRHVQYASDDPGLGVPVPRS